MDKKYHLTRVIEKYGWDAERRESQKLVADDDYDPMNWDDFVSNIGYLLEGHKGQTITVKIKMEKEDE